MSSLLITILLAIAPADAPTLIFRGGQIFDPGSMQTRPLGQLWIQGDRVLGEHPAETAVPSGVTLVDASGCTLLPGLFDLHVHVSVPGSGLGAMVDVTPEDNLRSHLACGVTSVVDLHADPSMIFPLRDRSRSAPDLARL